MKKKNSYRWLIWILLAVILIGVALWNILPPYLDRMKSEQDYQIDHQDELSLASITPSFTPGTTKNICAKISMAMSISPEVSFWKD